MDADRVDLVLASPLGRQFLAEQLGFAFTHSLFEDLGLGPVPGSVHLSQLFSPSRRRAASRHITNLTSDEVAQVFAKAVERGEWRSVLDLDELGLLALLAPVSMSFGFSGGDEELWALSALAKEALRPVAHAVLSSEAAEQWWDPIYRRDQRFLAWEGAPRPDKAEFGQMVRSAMAEERAANEDGLRRGRPQVKPGVRVGATWWSAPGFAERSWTTAPVGDVPSIALGRFIDTLMPWGPATATVLSLEIAGTARVLEIDGPADWQALVRRFPRDATGTHDGEWRDWGGVSEPWRLPDWEQVMDHYDGVHVTIGGYVASCGVALPVDDGFTMLAGWVPDATLWLADATVSACELGKWSNASRSWSDVWEYVRDGWHPTP